mmetsp:Transcript_7783/g.19307  ORF Transcript_7783/g.19307 Transcript_7783/m.19307 type:complete len:221 (-) Transcript_7783:559-1221(-)
MRYLRIRLHAPPYLFREGVDRDGFSGAHVVHGERRILPLSFLQQRQHDRARHILHVHEIPRHETIPQYRNIRPVQRLIEEQADDAAVRILRILTWTIHVEEPKGDGGGLWTSGVFRILFIHESIVHDALHSVLCVSVRGFASVGRRLPQWQQFRVWIAVDCGRRCGDQLSNRPGLLSSLPLRDSLVIIAYPIHHLLRSLIIYPLVLVRIFHALGHRNGRR